MANSIAKFVNYIALLDEVYAAASKTAVLDTPGLANAMVGAGEFKVPKMTMDGLGDYSRSGGYAKGSVTLEFETRKAEFDRGRKFEVDAMDNEETAGVAFGQLSAQFIRTKVVPELDAYRFAQYATKAGTAVAADISTGADTYAAISLAMTTMSDAEVPDEGRYLFITPTLAQAIRDMDTTKSKDILSKFAGVVEVPSGRFSTAITQKDGTTSGEIAGGFAKSGVDINFMVVSKEAVLQLSKHTVNKVISPEDNQESDGWLFFFRAYGIADAYDNKTKGIYLHKKTS